MKGKMKLKQNSFLLLVTILLFFIMYGIGCGRFNAQCCMYFGEKNAIN